MNILVLYSANIFYFLKRYATISSTKFDKKNYDFLKNQILSALARPKVAICTKSGYEPRITKRLYSVPKVRLLQDSLEIVKFLESEF